MLSTEEFLVLYHDAQGRIIGDSYQGPNNTRTLYHDAAGRNLGTSYEINGKTQISDAQDRHIGEADEVADGFGWLHDLGRPPAVDRRQAPDRPRPTPTHRPGSYHPGPGGPDSTYVHR